MLTIDEKKNIISADVTNAGRVETYECEVTSCSNPVCTCGFVCLELTSMPETNDENLVERQVQINLVERTLARKDNEQLSKDDLAFSERFLSQLSEDDFDILTKEYLVIKNEITEEAAPESIDTDFEYNEIERDGLMCAYNDVLPYGDQFLVTVADKKCIVFDQYCVLPNCSCADTMLSFYEVEGSGNKKDELLSISLDYKKKKWELTEDGRWPGNVGIVKSSLLDEFPDFYKQLKTRHSKLKTIYANCRKRNYSPRQEILPQKVGRNDPCPCGSGKKFKKCCLNKH